MLNVTVIGDREVIQRFAGLPERAHHALVAEVTTLALELQAHVVQDKLQGQVLNHITGRLQSSIQHDVQVSGTTVTGRVGFSVCLKSAAFPPTPSKPCNLRWR
jgi:hypothetical protein